MTTIPSGGAASSPPSPTTKPGALAQTRDASANADATPRAGAPTATSGLAAPAVAALTRALADLAQAPGGDAAQDDASATPRDIPALVADLNPDNLTVADSVTERLSADEARDLAQIARGALSAQTLNITNQTPQVLAGLAR